LFRCAIRLNIRKGHSYADFSHNHRGDHPRRRLDRLRRTGACAISRRTPSAKPKPASTQIVGNVDIDAKSTLLCWPCGISVRARAEQKTLYEDGATDVGAANGPPPTGSTDIGKPATNLAHMKQVLTVGTSVGAPRYK
jgi:hypothetical protein